MLTPCGVDAEGNILVADGQSNRVDIVATEKDFEEFGQLVNSFSTKSDREGYCNVGLTTSVCVDKKAVSSWPASIIACRRADCVSCGRVT